MFAAEPPTALFTGWLSDVLRIVRDNPARLPEVGVERHAFGRVNSLPSRAKRRGVVIAAPHGSFDWHTAELVEEMSYRTGLAAVTTRGFTPTECGGWRINVNRPMERRYPTDTLERATLRARDVFRQYSQAVRRAAAGALELYIEMHQNGTEENIEVATPGVGHAEAEAIKRTYLNIRDRVLRHVPASARVDLTIEPVDALAIGAWATKQDGALRLAAQSLHFELPAQRIFHQDRLGRAYAQILSELITDIASSKRRPLAERQISAQRAMP